MGEEGLLPQDDYAHARLLANNSSPFPPHARAASANGVVTRHDDRGGLNYSFTVAETSPPTAQAQTQASIPQ